MKNSYFIIPLSLLAHLISLNLILYLFTPATYVNIFGVIYYSLAWVAITYSINFYPTARREGFMTHVGNFLRLFFLFGLAYFASFSFMDYNPYSNTHLLGVYLGVCVLFTIYRHIFFWFRDWYRSAGGNSVRVVVIGRDNNLNKIKRIFDDPALGYRYVGYFDNQNSNSPTYLGDIESAFTFIFENNIDEVYCTASQLSKMQMKQLIAIADNNLKKVRVIPDHKELVSRATSIELYNTVPILKLRSSPLELEYANLVKRIFDVFFSGLVIVLILSWLVPLVYLLLKIDSKGPLFFKQKRHGIDLKTFWCYKFRTMTESNERDTLMAKKNDLRVTRLGRFLRKTSIDELPQFFNVFKGDMSVVGPRPHMEIHTREYENSVDKYLVRHFIKPGITGLAQIKGYRGEIIEKKDIINRVRFDIFYMEKWSLQLDFLIIFYTMINVLIGQEKAY